MPPPTVTLFAAAAAIFLRFVVAATIRAALLLFTLLPLRHAADRVMPPLLLRRQFSMPPGWAYAFV